MTELIKSPLFEEIRNYLKTADPEKQIFLYVPYIKTKTLSKLVDGIKNITIITTWHMRDLVFGSSEVELYQFCKDHNYTLYVNNKIHLKVYSIALDSAIVATGNISVGGLEGGNEECGILVKELSVSEAIIFRDTVSNLISNLNNKLNRDFQYMSNKIENSLLTAMDDLKIDSDKTMTSAIEEVLESKTLKNKYQEDLNLEKVTRERVEELENFLNVELDAELTLSNGTTILTY